MFVDELEERITEYSTFITNTLQPQLKQAVTAREETEEEICEYFKLRNSLQMIIDSNIDDAKPINTFVDISHQTLFCNATISNPLTVYVNIGFGFHVEFTINEAISFIDKRILYLKNDVLKHRSEVATTIAEDVEKALAVLEEFKAA
jgi:prefoldin subunit 5